MKKLYTYLALSLSLLLCSPANAHTNKTLSTRFNQTKNLDLKYVDFTFMNVLGRLKEITLPISKAEKAIDGGIFFDGSSVQGYTSINESDLLLKADLGSTFLSPWQGTAVGSARIMCDIYGADGKPYPHCPRSVLKKALDKAKDAGFKCYCGIELEFHLLKKTQEGVPVPADEFIYCDAITDIEMKTFKNAMMHALEFAGIEVEKTHHEVAEGQHEIVLKYNDPLFIADSLVVAKNIMQTMAKQHDYIISFMPKPIARVNGNGMHIHFSMWDIEQNKNAFYDAKREDFLSDTARYFMAGNLNRLQETTFLLNSSVNSFKRLVPGYEAPVYAAWGKKNRSTAIRIPETNEHELLASDGAPMRTEFRSPDPSCNPYFAFAAIITAGLEGVKNKEALAPEVEQNLYNFTQDQLDALHIKTIPTSLGACLEVFKNSSFVNEFLGESLQKKLTDIKEIEWRDYSKREEHSPFVISGWEKKYHNLKF